MMCNLRLALLTLRLSVLLLSRAAALSRMSRWERTQMKKRMRIAARTSLTARTLTSQTLAQEMSQTWTVTLADQAIVNRVNRNFLLLPLTPAL